MRTRELFTRINIKRNKRNLMILSLFGILVVGGLAWLFVSLSTPNSQEIALKGMRADYEAMKEKGPTSNSVKTQADYYQLLTSKATDAQRYDEAIKAFDNRVEILGDKMPPSDYTQKATIYCRMNDKDAAIAALESGAGLKQASEGSKAHLNAGKKLITEQGCDAWLMQLDKE